MEKKKMAKALVLTAAMTGGIAVAQSFFNEAHATNCDQCVLKGALGITVSSCFSKPGATCSAPISAGISLSCNNAQKC
ncbi:MAG: hypothetical protein ACK4GN_14440 [Runella sp.]